MAVLSAGWLACRGLSTSAACSALREIKEKAGGGGDGKEEKGDAAAAQARGLGPWGWPLGDWAHRTAAYCCSRPDSLFQARFCGAPGVPGAAASCPGHLAGRRDLVPSREHGGACLVVRFCFGRWLYWALFSSPKN